MSTPAIGREDTAPASGWGGSAAGLPVPFGQTVLFFASAASCVAALAVGGVAWRYSAGAMIVELFGVGLVGISLIVGPRLWSRPGARFPLLVTAAVLLLVAIQLIPLPPAVWARLPGRDLLWATAVATGDTASWRPLSVDPERTVASALSLVAPIGMMLAVLAIREAWLPKLLTLILLMVGLQLLAGMFQVASGGIFYYPYADSDRAVAVGFFTNRNHFGTLLLVGIVIAAMLFGRGPGPLRPARVAALAAVMLCCAAGVLVTGSRTAALLLAPALLLGPLVGGWIRGSRRVRLGMFAGALSLVLLVVVLLSAAGPYSAGGRLAARFLTFAGEERYGYWQDTIFGIRQSFPFGYGIGTFETVYRSLERLSEVGTHYTNHAHDDYLELVMEGGLPALALLLVFFAWFVRAGWFAWAMAPGSAGSRYARGAWCALLLMLLHTLVDYPLRSMSLLTLFGFFLALLARAAPRISGKPAAGGQGGELVSH